MDAPKIISTKKYRAKPGKPVDLTKWATRDEPICGTRAQLDAVLATHVKATSDVQGRLWANDRFAILVVLQGMDAAGKDGVIKHVMSGVNPQGCRVTSFKQPSSEELKHDFLWRAAVALPPRGMIGIFNRSYYEETLIVRVHPEILGHEEIPESLVNPKKIWDQRFKSIVNLEKHLHHNGTRVVKFFLHLSREEQRKRFLARIDDPHKNWKLSTDDIRERALWKDYMHAYGECIGATSMDHAPWFIVPADDKHNARLIISQIVLDTLESLKLKLPEASEERKKELKSIRKQLERD